MKAILLAILLALLAGGCDMPYKIDTRYSISSQGFGWSTGAYIEIKASKASLPINSGDITLGKITTSNVTSITASLSDPVLHFPLNSVGTHNIPIRYSWTEEGVNYGPKYEVVSATVFWQDPPAPPVTTPPTPGSINVPASVREGESI